MSGYPVVYQSLRSTVRVPTARGNRGNGGGNIPVMEKTGSLEILPQGMLYGQVVNFLILKIVDIAIFAATFSNLFLGTECVGQVSFDQS